MIILKVLLTIAAMILSGTLGRMGGTSRGTLWRDLGCTICLLAVTVLWSGWHPALWLAYAAAGVATYGAFTTYWDWLFGYDNLWISGAMVGVAGLPLMWVVGEAWWLLPVRIAVLCIAWGSLNKYLPERVFFWRRDVAEENLRYQISL